MSPLTPHWNSPSHPDVQEVIMGTDGGFTTMSRSRVDVPAFGVFAKLSSPPCTAAAAPSYATVQVGRDRHLDLNSDLLYMNHSCDPSLIVDAAGGAVLAGPRGLRAGDELTFFYPSTEWRMAQPFACACRAPACRGTIAGAEAMRPADLEGVWLNPHIRELLEERDAANAAAADGAAAASANRIKKLEVNGAAARRGATSRELSGEMGGDTREA